MRFVLASGNKNKLREFRAILAPHEVVAMPAGLELPPEGVTSFRENALGKARGLAEALAAQPSLRAQVAGVTAAAVLIYHVLYGRRAGRRTAQRLAES